MPSSMYDGDYCGNLHDTVRAMDESATRETLKLSGDVVAVWHSNGPVRPDVARDIADSCVAVRARRMGR
jgi:hypothetical protein